MSTRTAKLETKHGRPIIGTLERIHGLGRASTVEVSETGKVEPQHEGQTDVWWDGQRTLTADDEGGDNVFVSGDLIYIGENGQEYHESDLVLVYEDGTKEPIRDMRKRLRGGR